MVVLSCLRFSIDENQTSWSPFPCQLAKFSSFSVQQNQPSGLHFCLFSTTVAFLCRLSSALFPMPSAAHPFDTIFLQLSDVQFALQEGKSNFHFNLAADMAKMFATAFQLVILYRQLRRGRKRIPSTVLKLYSNFHLCREREGPDLRPCFQKVYLQLELQEMVLHTCYTSYATHVGARVKP